MPARWVKSIIGTMVFASLLSAQGVTPPTVLSRVEPAYTEAARAARLQGTVLLEAAISAEGIPKVSRVVRSLGFGLDENAIAAIEQWRFRPGTRNGKPIEVSLNIEVNFNLNAAQLQSAPPQLRSGVTSIAVAPSAPNVVYAISRLGTVFKTTDGGSTWRELNVSDVTAVVVDPKDDAIVYGVTRSGLYKTTDGGAMWTPVAGWPASRHLQVDSTNSSVIYAATIRGVIKSIDGAKTWREVLPGNSFSSLTIEKSSPATIYALSDSGDLFKSADNGDTWRFISGGIVQLATAPISAGLINSSDAIDSSLPAPALISPADGAIFDIFPRRTTVQWAAVPGAASYLVEWDYSYDGVWHTEAKKMPGTGLPARGLEFTLDFVGAQPGRWRVWPVNAAGQRGNPSVWRTFRYLK